MTQCMCIVQSGQTPDQKKTAIESLLNDFTQSTFGEDAEVNWVRIDEGNGFTAALPSTSSIVSMTAHEPLSHDRRLALLTDFCDRWMEATGCSLNEIVAAINDPQLG